MHPFYRFCRFWCRWFCILFFRVRIYHKDRVPAEGGVLLVCNHQSFFDPVLATMALKREGNYLARDTLFANRWFGRMIEALNAFPVRRNRADVQAVKEIIRRLRAGRLVTAFPEGTRTGDGSVGRFLPGAVAVALRAGATVVPVLIEGAFASWPRNRRYPRPAPVTVRYGEPLGPEELEDYSPAQLAEVLRRRVIGLRPRGATPTLQTPCLSDGELRQAGPGAYD